MTFNRRKVGLIIFVVGSLGSSLVLYDFVRMGMTITQALWACAAWVTVLGLFFIGYEIMTRRR